MSKYIKPLVACAFALLLMLQLVSLSLLCTTRSELADVRIQMNSVTSNLSGTVYSATQNAISSARLPQESQLASFVANFGALDVDSMTLPMHIALTPKQVSGNTAVSLRIDGVLYDMQRSDTQFTLTHPISAIYGVGEEITVMIRDGEETKTQIERVYYSREGYLQALTAFEGLGYSVGYSKNKIASLRFRGNPQAYMQVDDGRPLQAVRLVALLDGALVHEQSLDIGALNHGRAGGESGSAQLDFTLDVKQGQNLMVWLQAKDEWGLIHQMLLQGGTVDAQGLTTTGELYALREELLFKADGELLINEAGYPQELAVFVPW